MTQMRAGAPPVFAAAALALSACATAAESRAMVPPPPAVQAQAQPLRGAIAIAKVGGGEETAAYGVSKVGNKELEEALRISLDQCGFLTPPNVNSSFGLEAFLVELKQPLAGLTMKVDSFVRYKITSNLDGRVVLDDIVTASYTATMGDALGGITRLKLANEGAIRANIAAFLARLNSLDSVK
jgi:hypothetical protein